MTDDATIENRVSTLEQTAERHEVRITSHGKEIDALKEQLIVDRTENRHRDERAQRTESKIDSLDGKVTSILMRPSEKWNSAVRTAITAAVTMLVTFLLTRAGLS